MKRLLLMIVVLTSMLAASAQAQVEEEKVNGPQITFENTLHEYGDIYVGSDGSFAFEFVNTGNEPLILSKPRSSCGCTVPSWPKEPILPGESNEIKVTYNTRKAGAFNKTVTIYSNATNKKTIVLRIKGKVMAQPAEKLPEKENAIGAAPGSN